MHYTFRAETLQQTLREVHRVLGPDATVIGTAEVRVPHHPAALGYEVVASGVPQVDYSGPSTLPGLHDRHGSKGTPHGKEEGPLPQEAAIPSDGLTVSECVEELIAQLWDVVNDIEGLKRLRADWAETRTLLEEARQEVHSMTDHWESSWAVDAEDSHALWARCERTVAVMVGAGGTGKTTAALKIAARCAEMGVKIGLIQWVPGGSASENPPGAFSLVHGEVPLRLAGNRPEMMRAIFTLSDVDLILVDTPGHAPWDEGEMDGLFAALEGPGIEFHLVLPATWNEGDIAEAIETYGSRVDGIVLSQVDRLQSQNVAAARLPETGTRVHIMERSGIWTRKEWLERVQRSARQSLPVPGKPCRAEGELKMWVY